MSKSCSTADRCIFALALAIAAVPVPGWPGDPAREPAGASVVSGQGAPSVRVQEINEPFAAPAIFERTFDFDALPLAGSFASRTLDGITVEAPSRAWVHLDGSPLPGRVARQPDAAERWTIRVPPDTHAFELRLWESTIPGVAANSCFNFDFCTDTRYEVGIFSGGTRLRAFFYSPFDDTGNRLALWSSAAFDRIELTADTNNVDDEFLGDLRTSAAPLPGGYPQRIASRTTSGFGRAVALHGGLALIGDDAGFDAWRVDGSGAWRATGRRTLGEVSLAALQGQRAALVVGAAGGPQRIVLLGVAGDDPAAWPAVELPFAGTPRALDLHADLAVLGLDDRVLVYRFEPAGGWRFERELTPDPPIAGTTSFGGSIGLDGDLLVVGVDSDMFHLYRRTQDAAFVEVYRQDQARQQGTRLVDVSGDTVVQQGLAGNLRVFRPGEDGEWREVQNAFEPLPVGTGLGLANSVRIDGDRMLALQAFRGSGEVEFRQAVSIWMRQPGGAFERAGVFVDPHVRGTASAGLGNNGRALALHRDHVAMGQPFTPWCEDGGNALFGDTAGNAYGDICGGRSGAALMARASALVALFADGFEAAAD